MQHGMQMIELAQSIEKERARDRDRYPSLDGPSNRPGRGLILRQRIGHRLIAVGERLARGRPQVITR